VLYSPYIYISVCVCVCVCTYMYMIVQHNNRTSLSKACCGSLSRRHYDLLIYAWLISWGQMLEQVVYDIKGVLDTTLYDKVCQWVAAGRWFSPGTTVSSTNKTDCPDIAEILLKVALNTITLTLISFYKYFYFTLLIMWNTKQYHTVGTITNTKQYHTVGTILTTNRKTVERDKMDTTTHKYMTSNTQIHDL
jgi:hypothetical protein